MERSFGDLRRGSCLVMLVLLVQSLLSTANAAEDAAPAGQAGREQAGRAAQQAAIAATIHGPSKIALRDQASLALPEGYGFIPLNEAAALMKLMGNSTGSKFIGLIVPEHDQRNWLVSVDFDDAGYIKDDDAKDWDAKELLQSLQEGTQAGNEERKQLGIPAIKVTRWIEPPSYSSATHQLVWSAEAKLRDSADPDPTINYNTYVLGREGYISLNLITSASTIDADKPAAKQLLAAVEFNSGKRYTEFKSSTDKVAAYGLAALVAGVAAKKLGMIALAGAFILKFAKVFAVAAAAGGGGLWRWLKSRAGNKPDTPA